MSRKMKIFGSVILAIIPICVFLNKPSKPTRALFHLPDSYLSEQTWDQILEQNAPIDSFKVLHTGSVKVPRAGMLNEQKLPSNHGLTEYLWVDVFVFLFHHEEKGWYMIDTGLDSTFQANGNIKGLLAGNYIKASEQQKGQNIAAQLERENRQINGIFLTHLHGDHTAGLPEIDGAIPKFIGKGERYTNIPFLYYSNHLSRKDTLLEMDWERGVEISPLESVIDIFGDGSLLGIHTPGHSNSHLSYLLMTAEGPILLTGDASHTKYGFQHNIEPGWVEDSEMASNSLNQLVAFHQMYPDVKVIYGHDR